MTRLHAIALTALLAVGLGTPAAWALTSPATHHGVMTVEDNAKAFTPEGIKKAEDTFHDTNFRAPTELVVVTYLKVPESKHADYEKVKNIKADKARFFGDWAKELAKSRGSKGIFVLVSREGGHVHAIDDRQNDVYRKFDDKDLKVLEKKIGDGFQKAGKTTGDTEAKEARDEGLLHGVQFVASELKNTTVPEATDHKTNASQDKSSGSGGFFSGIMGWICIGVAVLLGIWLVVGLIRMFTGGGGGGGNGPGGGGGGGYGGGGGGFMTGLIGGMLGAAAGMYMYDHFVRDHNSGDSGANNSNGYDNGNNTTGDTGAGDYDGGGDGGGTDYDDGGNGGGNGGGDAGGGGGDFGGGDFGGGDGGGGGDVGGGDW